MSGILTKYYYGIIPFGIASLPWTLEKTCGGHGYRPFPRLMYSLIGLTTLCAVTYPITFPYIIYDTFTNEEDR